MKGPYACGVRAPAMMSWIIIALMLLNASRLLEARLLSPSSALPRAERRASSDSDPLVNVIVTYRDNLIASTEAHAFSTSYQSRNTGSSGMNVRKTMDANSTSFQAPYITAEFARTNAVAMTIPSSQLVQLQEDPRVALVEHDIQYYPLQTGTGESTPWGVSSVQGDSSAIPNADTSSSCFQLCIIDSGLYVGHPDIPYNLGASNIKGQSFGLPSNQPWYSPADSASHGTHVAGTILAQGGNGIGVVGIVPRNQNICLSVARVFGDGWGGQSSSQIQTAVEWCASNQARVINMSLGAPGFSSNMASLFKNLRDEGILVFAASGNTGDGTMFYPAAYNDVVSVAAVDSNLQRPSFSTYNSQVNVTAPGVAISSTVPVAAVLVGGYSFDALTMDRSVTFPNQVAGRTIDCKWGASDCTGAQGKICIFVRGLVGLDDVGSNCKRNGGIGVIVYNNNANEGVFSGALSYTSTLDIPVVSVAAQSGPVLIQTGYAVINMRKASYAGMSGTSMATAHASGVATKIWAARPRCTANQILQALYSTAKDVGPAGRDVFTGNGLLQAASAYKYLLTLPQPCGNQGYSGQSNVPNKVVISDDNTKDDGLRLYGGSRQRGTTRQLKGFRRMRRLG